MDGRVAFSEHDGTVDQALRELADSIHEVVGMDNKAEISVTFCPETAMRLASLIRRGLAN